VLTKQQKR